MEETAAARSVKKWRVDIDRDWCKGCAVCVAFCPRQVLEMDAEGKAAVRDLARCTGCRACELHCPDLAIELSAKDMAGAADGGAPGPGGNAGAGAAGGEGA